ncbi:MAG TPA: HAD family phosphatase [Tepidisphaeraceae bacterium]|nr:HAD family phosphatase [Tepidisphaeraceae bacterium]
MQNNRTPDVAAIFDMDGVLVLTEEAHWKSWLEAAKPREVELSYAAFKSCFGRVNPDCIPILFGSRSPDDSIAIADEKEAAFRRIVSQRVPLVPGIVELLTALQQLGVRLGVGSSGPPENVKALVEGGRIALFFRATVDGSEVRRGKPAPDVFLTCAQRLEVSPTGCAVIEDAPVGIRAAVAADMLAIGVATTHPEAELRQAGAAHVFQDPAAIDPARLAGLLRERAAAGA